LDEPPVLCPKGAKSHSPRPAKAASMTREIERVEYVVGLRAMVG
jgi:hypothetical protein